MKEYGKDLLNQYNRVKTLESSLIANIKKRNQYLITHADNKVLDKTNLNLQFDSKDTKLLLDQIIAIEKAYTDQSQQLSMFDKE